MTHNIPVSKINELISSCDERMAKIEVKMNAWKPYEMMMGLMEKIHDKEEDKKVFSEAPHREETKNYENSIKLINVEKMMWNAMKNKNARKEIFKHILAKYDELMRVSYALVSPARRPATAYVFLMMHHSSQYIIKMQRSASPIDKATQLTFIVPSSSLELCHATLYIWSDNANE